MSRLLALVAVLVFAWFAPHAFSQSPEGAAAAPSGAEAQSDDLSTAGVVAGAGKAAADLRDLVIEFLSNSLGIPHAIADLVARLVVFLVILLVFKVAGRIVASVIGAAMQKSRLKPTQLLLDFITGTTRNLILVFGMIMALAVIGVEVAPLLAGIGVIGFVVGFALQETLGNFAAGIMILLYRPFDVGHFVTAGGVTGTVKAMSLVSTTIATPDNQVQIVPNGSIWGGVITNVTANPTRRVDLIASVHYRDDIDAAQAILERVVKSNPLVLQDPAPVVRLDKLGESSVDFVVRPWCKTEDYWTVRAQVTRSIKLEIEKAGLSIPFPQRDVHLHQVG